MIRRLWRFAPSSPTVAPALPSTALKARKRSEVRPVAVVDCTAFYCSCERVFQPQLERLPVAVLSNNDGCVIARSKEVKAAGIRMGEPYFRARRRLESAGAAVFSSNYALYADMSRRVMGVLRQFTPDVEVYSIDEAFLALPPAPAEALLDMGHEMRERVLRWTGIPVHVGVGATKTLSKVADELARKAEGSVFALAGADGDDALLDTVAASDVWGIGPSYAALLASHGVTTARQLRDVPRTWARRHMTVVGERIVLELRGTSCLPLELQPPQRGAIARTRSFSQPLHSFEEIERAVATYASRAAEKARAHGLVARGLEVFITTKYHGPGPHHTDVRKARLPVATSYTPDIIRAASELIQRMYRRGYGYRKAGVILTGLREETPEQLSLFAPPEPEHRRLMRAMDAVNERMGAGTIYVAAAAPGMAKQHEAWQMAQERRSPTYTTSWRDLMRVA